MANRYNTLAPGTTGIKFTVTIVNHSPDNYDPSLFHADAQSGNAEAEQIFDSAGGLSGSPSTVLLPEREVTFPVGFSVTDPADLVMQIRPGFDYKDAIFVS